MFKFSIALLCVVCTAAWIMAEDAKPADNAGAGDLKLFEKGAAWDFKKNTGDGSFELAGDGALPIGVLHYDFTKSKTQKTPYVLATTSVTIPETESFQIDVRSARPINITIRFKDEGGQTLQFKGKVKGGADWETVRVSLTRKLEHWGGANDGKIHFPIKQLALSVPAPASEPKEGKIEFAKAQAGGK